MINNKVIDGVIALSEVVDIIANGGPQFQESLKAMKAERGEVVKATTKLRKVRKELDEASANHAKLGDKTRAMLQEAELVAKKNAEDAEALTAREQAIEDKLQALEEKSRKTDAERREFLKSKREHEDKVVADLEAIASREEALKTLEEREKRVARIEQAMRI